jgi:hypothetical protein
MLIFIAQIYTQNLIYAQPLKSEFGSLQPCQIILSNYATKTAQINRNTSL